MIPNVVTVARRLHIGYVSMDTTKAIHTIIALDAIMPALLLGHRAPKSANQREELCASITYIIFAPRAGIRKRT